MPALYVSKNLDEESMKFSKLMEFKADEAGNIDIDELVLHLPNTPLDVIEQFYSDHGRNSQFQEQYENIDISKLKWELVELSYDDIAHTSIFSEFENWSTTCKMKSERVSIDNDWNFIGHNRATVQHWKGNSTWLRSPIMFLSKSNYHLVEGHSRYGCLTGLVNSGIISSKKTHQVWVANV
ncbi:hypothetical protein BTO23_15565 [Aliivibrio sifiae]|uniref:Uncharacterized protein n=2 Tax=Aliivibrio sifiae TaxID=566293 RepID=A0A2S7X8R3_9GAMM|nr:hypothetical protein BTO23_15565 [Aliivibrio sifiae]